MAAWEDYPENYRGREVAEIREAVCAGECVSVIGLSGSGKSNLMGFLARRIDLPAGCPRFVLVDCNRLMDAKPQAFYRLAHRALGGSEVEEADDELEALEAALERQMAGKEGVCLLLDRFDALSGLGEFPTIASNLRALRDDHKYRLTYVTAARRPLDPHTELAELFFGHPIWLGPLAKEDALWSAHRDAERFSGRPAVVWNAQALEKLVDSSWGYPSFLRGACEAYAAGAPAETEVLRTHPAVERRVAEFWADGPDEDAIARSGLAGHPFLRGRPAGPQAKPLFDTSQLTAKENLLLAYLLDHAGQVCEKDDLVRAVWPEDVIYEQGIRDESLAQLMRRLRVKIEPDAANPTYIQTVPGRGYLFRGK